MIALSKEKLAATGEAEPRTLSLVLPCAQQRGADVLTQTSSSLPFLSFSLEASPNFPAVSHQPAAFASRGFQTGPV